MKKKAVCVSLAAATMISGASVGELGENFVNAEETGTPKESVETYKYYKEYVDDFMDDLKYLSDEEKSSIKKKLDEIKLDREKMTLDETEKGKFINLLKYAYNQNEYACAQTEKKKENANLYYKEYVDDFMNDLKYLSDEEKSSIKKKLDEIKLDREKMTLAEKEKDRFIKILEDAYYQNEIKERNTGSSKIGSSSESTASKYENIAGTNRYQTAVKVSMQRFSDNKAENIVIVGGTSVIDGLSAAPLASAYNAPVLLAQKSSIDEPTLNEIKRVGGDMNKKTVYIVGGSSSVSESVVDQLKKKFPGVLVKRLEGASRYETSLNVAEYLTENKKIADRLIAVGGYGEADAMSIAPVASDKTDKTLTKGTVDPILVVRKNTLGSNFKQFITKFRFRNAIVVGGDNMVSSELINEIKGISNIDGSIVERVYGSNRYETNLSILKRFYSSNNESNKIQMRGLIVASGNKDKLVDAQTASVLASDLGKEVPMMLVGNNITNTQVKYLKDNKASLSNKVSKVGGSVSDNAMKTILSSLGL